MTPTEELDSLRTAGADLLDPVRFRFAESLALRLPAAADAVRPLLAATLRATLAELQSCNAPKTAPEPGPEADNPLGLLNLELQAPAELRNATRFRHAWGRLQADETVERALHRGPDNAGPLNSHQLILQSLLRMRELSPDYLRRYLAQADALLRLERPRARLSP